MARKVFFSFHYQPDCVRASQVRNIGVIEGNPTATDNDWETITRGGDAGAAGLPVAFAILEGGKGEAELGGGLGRADAQTHAVGGTGLDGHIGTVEDAFGIAGIAAEGAIDPQRAIGDDELHVFVGAMVEAPAFGRLAGLGGVEGFAKERRAGLVGAGFVDAGGDGVAIRPREVLIDDVPLGGAVAEVAVFDAGLVGEHDVSPHEVAAHHGAVVADGVIFLIIPTIAHR